MNILPVKRGDFGHTRAGVIHELKEKAVALPAEGIGVGGQQDGLHFRGGETAQQRPLEAFHGDGQHAGGERHDLGGLLRGKTHEGVNSAQTDVAGASAVVPLGVQVLQEG